MSTRTLIAALYVFGGLLVLMVSLLTYRVYREPGNVGPPDGTVGTRLSPDGPHTTSLDPVRQASPHQLIRLQQRMRELESSLQRASSMLETRTSQLQQKNRECQTLQADLDESLKIVLGFLAEENGSEKMVNLGSVSGATPTSRTDAEQLEADLKQTEFLASEQARELEELRREVSEYRVEIAALQLAAEQEINALMAGQQDQESTAIRALVQTGSAAVPALTGQLADSRPEVRAFAAYVLGEIGPDAEEATTALLSLLSDSDETVREQSRQALAKIAPM